MKHKRKHDPELEAWRTERDSGVSERFLILREVRRLRKEFDVAAFEAAVARFEQAVSRFEDALAASQAGEPLTAALVEPEQPPGVFTRLRRRFLA